MSEIHSCNQRVIDNLIKERDELKAEIATLKEGDGAQMLMIETLEKERDELKVRVEELKKMYPCCTIHGEPACSGCAANCHNAEVERDSLKAEVVRLKDELFRSFLARSYTDKAALEAIDALSPKGKEK